MGIPEFTASLAIIVTGKELVAIVSPNLMASLTTSSVGNSLLTRPAPHQIKQMVTLRVILPHE